MRHLEGADVRERVLDRDARTGSQLSEHFGCMDRNLSKIHPIETGGAPGTIRQAQDSLVSSLVSQSRCERQERGVEGTRVRRRVQSTDQSPPLDNLLIQGFVLWFA